MPANGGWGGGGVCMCWGGGGCGGKKYGLEKGEAYAKRKVMPGRKREK